ncbi:DUF4231 domain-containing protein [Mucilaginibacter celer]|uniref:DUF4231 domain-containing protein n=1 Tax=Mucilaginibacter celer TaxID=2305508 RepID=A0A494VUR2_9SPHI|nr:DUF4231 domain-containing protein [Mucilaginibacter celer]AYL97791.1 DUF4231 domain-containing protein [Mucilaginibacter celer]
MDKELFDKYVEERYQGQMKFYSDSSRKNQGKYRKFQWALIILSALTPVFAALSNFKFDFLCADSKAILNMLVIIVSVIVAILTTGLKTFSYQELWVTYRSTNELLKPEIYYYRFNVGPYGVAGVDKESLFVTRVEKILGAEHVNWPPAKQQTEGDGKQKPGEGGQQAGAEAGGQEVKPESQAGDNANPTTGEEKPGTGETEQQSTTGADESQTKGEDSTSDSGEKPAEPEGGA